MTIRRVAVSLLRFTANVALFLVACGILLVSSECSMRVFDLWYIPDYSKTVWYAPSSLAGVPYVLKSNLDTYWGQGHIVSNEFGIRDLHTPTKPAGVRRILALGDSITFGFGVDQSDSFPAKLEKLLNETGGQRYEVINAGIPGFNIQDEAAFLPHLLERYRPDIVIWTVIVNDYDDSLGVDRNGLISWTAADYVTSLDFLGGWGYHWDRPLDPHDFRNSMSEGAIRWADGRPSVPSWSEKWDSWLRTHLLVYSWARTRFPQLRGNWFQSNVPSSDRYKSSSGSEYRWPQLAPVYSSRHSIGRANNALEQAIQLGVQSETPIVLLNTTLPLDDRWRKATATPVYKDMAGFLDEPFLEFILDKNNNLGWDGHFNARGNAGIAAAVNRILGCEGLGPQPTKCDVAATLSEDMEKYWLAFEEKRRAFVQESYGSLDLDAFRGIHQILGGILPPRTIFGPNAGRRANVLLPCQNTKALEITGSLKGDRGLHLHMTVFHESEQIQRLFELQPGTITVLTDLAPIECGGDDWHEPFEVQLECAQESCPELQLQRIGIVH